MTENDNPLTETLPPPPIVWAAWLHGFYAALYLFRIALRGELPSSPLAPVVWALVVLYLFILGRAVYRGRNWVRWWIFIITILSFISNFFVNVLVPTGIGYVTFIAQWVIFFIVPALLLLPSSRQWFRSNYAIKVTAE
jgi:hypothetical protein